MRAVVYKVKSELKTEVLNALENLCESKSSHTYDKIKSISGEVIKLNLSFLGFWNGGDMGYSTKIYFDDILKVPQYQESDFVTENVKKSTKVPLFYIDNDSVNNYLVLYGSKTTCNKLALELNNILSKKITNSQSSIRYIRFKINDDKINLLKEKNAISSLALMYVTDTDDSVVKSSKVSAKKGKDLHASEEYIRMTELSDKFKSLKFNSPKFKNKVTISDDGYFCSALNEVQFLHLIAYFLKEFQETGVISDESFEEILICN